MSLIKQAQQVLTETKETVNNIELFAESIDSTFTEVCESVTHVLAGLEQTTNNMNPKSVASFLAGVERIITVLPSATPEKQQSTVRLLQAAAMKFDDLTKKALPNQAVVKIAQYGASDAQAVQKYLGIVQQGPREIANAANKLRYAIDRAMTTSQAPQAQQQNQQTPTQQQGVQAAQQRQVQQPQRQVARPITR